MTSTSPEPLPQENSRNCHITRSEFVIIRIYLYYISNLQCLFWWLCSAPLSRVIKKLSIVASLLLFQMTGSAWPHRSTIHLSWLCPIMVRLQGPANLRDNPTIPLPLDFQLQVSEEVFFSTKTHQILDIQLWASKSVPDSRHSIASFLKCTRF